MARAVDVSVVTLSGLVLDVGDVDGDTTLLLFRSGVDLVEVVSRVDVRVLFVQDLGDGCGQGSLTVIDVADGTNVNVRLSTLVLFLCHVFCPPGRLVVSLELTSSTRYILLGLTGLCHFGARTQSALQNTSADWRQFPLKRQRVSLAALGLMISSETFFGTSA